MFSKSASNYQWALLANLTQALASWVILLIIIRLGDKQDVGLFSFLQAILVPIQLFFTLKLRTVQSADVFDEYTTAEYHLVRILSGVMSFSVSILILRLVSQDPLILWGGAFLAASYSIYIIRETLITELQKNNKNNFYFAINLSTAIFSILTFFISYTTTRNILTAIIWMTIARAASYFTIENMIFLSIAKKAKPLKQKTIENQKILRLVKFSAPLGITALLSALFTSIPQLLIKDSLGLEALGVYAALTSLLVAFNLLINSFIQSALPNLSKDYMQDQKIFFSKIKNSICRISAISVLATLGALTIGEYALLLLFGNDYTNYTAELALVTACGFTLSLFSIGNLILSAQRTFFLQLPIYLACATFVYSFTSALLPAWGISGALIAQAISYFLSFIISIFVFYIKEPQQNKKPPRIN